MLCPHCQSPTIRNLNRTTDLGYAVFRCRECGRKSNERTGTPFNFLEFPTDIVFDIVLCRLRYKLSPLVVSVCGTHSHQQRCPLEEQGSARDAISRPPAASPLPHASSPVC